MKKLQMVVIWLVVGVFLGTACAGQPGAPLVPTGTPPAAQESPQEPVDREPTEKSPSLPQPVPYPAEERVDQGDPKMVRGPVHLTEIGILVEGVPPKPTLHLSGSLPTPCHQLNVEIGEPDAENKIQIEVYSLADPNEMCIQVLHPIEESIPLGEFAAGDYTVWMNGEKIGGFSIPETQASR